MAETLTYDPGTDTVTVGDNLTPDEQESLQIGEEMQSQQEQLLAGKYKDAQELEKAYIELQKKLGSESTEETTETTEATSEESETESEPEYTPAQELIINATNEYNEKGEVSKDMMAEFSKMSSQDLVNAYVAFQQQAPAKQEAPAKDLSDAEINSLRNSVGGEAHYNQLIEWAGNNLEAKQIEAFDQLIAMGSVDTIQLAVKGLQAQYETANGYEGRMLSGKPPKSTGDVFKSQAQVVEAMSDSRYDKDPAYRQEIMEKLERSNIQF